MWFSGLAIGLPELLVEILSVLIGIPGAAVLWWTVLIGRRLPGGTPPPPSLYLVTASVLLDLFGLLVLWNLSAEAMSSTIFGVGTSTFVMSGFLLFGFFFLLLSVLVPRKHTASVVAATALLSKILGVIALFGIVCIIGCLPQAPWNKS